MQDLKPVDEALADILKRVTPTAIETIALSDALNRTLAEPVIARTSQPPFNGSAMDGYALKSADGQSGTKLKNIGIAAAGTPFDRPLKSGECARIYTGGELPEGADSVIMQEKVTVEGDEVTLIDDVKESQNVRLKGNDFAKDQTILAPGKCLNPFDLSLIAASGHGEVAAYQKPHLHLLATGDELVQPGQPLAPGQIYASNGFGLTPLFAQAGAKVKDFGVAIDEQDKLEEKLREALKDEPEILVTTGGASVGDKDYMLPALKAIGAELDFWRIAVRPGKPLMFGRLGETLIFGLPGNPVSALVTATVFVLPALRALTGQQPAAPLLTLPLIADLPKNGPRQFYRRARLIKDSGHLSVDPILETDSAHLSSMSLCDGFIVQPAFGDAQSSGNLISFLPMPWALR
ncbi:molybdopterin molybdotransferase MoeA [Maritalea mediterranea]|uniref:Molybdopterin molybdenumtransferase n=1 Tax=Maritalea mediterranea TaxID=2909667 RepID=A0ABS9E8K6_9HYPH|nr:gephyrin-like molybdotransferase Glp [Maritalea mediterranea]MCF4098542.1 molybdopterin molybdotransferase MoeA [Maritalea mediterranea]